MSLLKAAVVQAPAAEPAEPEEMQAARELPEAMKETRAAMADRQDLSI